MKKPGIDVFILSILFSLLFLTACRVRLTDSRQNELSAAQMLRDGSAGDMGMPEDSDHPVSAELNDPPAEGGETVENPESMRKEYDENASVEISGGTDRMIHGEGEGSGAFAEGTNTDRSVIKLDEGSDETALLTVPAEEADETGISEDGEAAESMLQYYTVLLQERSRSLYECKRLYVYWETSADHVTVFKTSPEHAMILNAGSYDVSARLTEDRLLIDDGWVVRKNPGVIVKTVESTALGSTVKSTEKAEAIRLELLGREGWSGIDAVRQNRVLLISEELLNEPRLQTAAMLAIAKNADPDLYEDVDPAEVLRMLIREGTGSDSDGIFFY